MEEKKTAKVNLEQNRGIYVLMALSVVLSSLLVVLEWSSIPNIPDFDINLKPLEMDYEAYLQEWFPPTPPLPEIRPVLPPIVYEGFQITEDTTEIVFPPEDTPEWIEPEEKPITVFIGLSDNPVLSSGKQTNPSDMPEYPGGILELKRFIYHAVNYPEDAARLLIQGRVICSFIINKDGSVSEIKIEKMLYESIDNEVLRVLRLIPSWKPANPPKQVKYIIPITFRL